MSDDEIIPLPDGEYAIIECLGHRTLVGRIHEVERFGTKLCAIEPLFDGALLPEIYVGGSSIYALTPCSKEVAWARQPRHSWSLPNSLRATLTTPQLKSPEIDDICDDED